MKENKVEQEKIIDEIMEAEKEKREKMREDEKKNYFAQLKNVTDANAKDRENLYSVHKLREQ